MSALDWPDESGGAFVVDETAVAFNHPRVGDAFSEMLSYWVYVIGVEGDCITTIEANPPCTFPTDGKVVWQSLEQFKKRFSYGGSAPGYWVRLYKRDADVSGWLEETKERCVEYIDK